ncbi:replication region DNA-binding N-term [Methylobacterium phyllostachyos]|uniref:Replication region DNA-binding N-term n=2 Tax=Methylobacterium phyllostachyos TaxID=582672 RepID=A0A1G9X099_9HYPH|nr:replication region DNA-binding N-term [Methylobacterium phyllostachyos]
MAGKRARAMPVNDRRKWEVWRAADEIRAEGGERVALRNVWARVKRNAGVAGNNQVVGEHLAQWAEERGYSPVIELAGIPDKVSAHLAKAAVELWKAAQDEAAMVLERERVRMAEAIATERELRNEALGMVDAREAVIEAQRAEIARLGGELERMRKHVRTVRALAFWRRVAQEVWEILPEREAMHLKEIVPRIGHEFVKEAEAYTDEWGTDLLRGVIDQRVKFKKLFAAEGSGRYRRRRPEDDAA